MISSVKAKLRRMLEEKEPAQEELAPDANFDETESAQEPSGNALLEGLSSTLPMLIGTALISATLVIGFFHFSPVAMPKVVAFDIVKYANSQRAIGSKLLGPKTDSDDVAPVLLEIGKKTQATIREVAGPNTLVVIRQAVVQGEYRDITDDVLKKLGMPTDVPTADPARMAFDVAPTMIGHPTLFTTDKNIVKEEQKAAQAAGLP